MTTAQEMVSYWPTEGWQVSTPEAQGMDSAELAGLFETYSQAHFNLDGLVVARHGYIVAEAYAPPFEANMKHHLYSASKSVTGALIGILLKEGYLDSLDTPMLSLFPNRVVQNLDADKQAITVRHLLTMTPGFKCDSYIPGLDVTQEMMASEDWLQYALDMPMLAVPGKEFHYCNGVTHILSAIITEKTGLSALDYAAEKLFKPLGITDYAWTSSPKGISYGFGDLQLTARDLLKFGYLYLHNGEWDGTQVIPADYVKDSLFGSIETGWPDTGYGYQWWYFPSNGVSLGLGWGGQYLFLDPKTDRIAVVLGGFTESLRVGLHAYPFVYTMAGLSASDSALPDSSEAQSQLDAVIARIKQPEPVVVQSIPEMASGVSDQQYTLFGPLPVPVAGSVLPAVIAGLRADFTSDQQAVLTFTLDNGESWVMPVGLDGLYQVSDSPVGLVGAKGHWETPDKFCVDIKYVGDAKIMRFEMTFMPGAVDILASEYVTGDAKRVQGMIMQ
ncbi:MAG: serine hydrolase [Anaerolineae bacterium]|nr:serine hydrolase [Anaerolineae bacterium]